MGIENSREGFRLGMGLLSLFLNNILNIKDGRSYENVRYYC